MISWCRPGISPIRRVLVRDCALGLPKRLRPPRLRLHEFHRLPQQSHRSLHFIAAGLRARTRLEVLLPLLAYRYCWLWRKLHTDLLDLSSGVLGACTRIFSSDPWTIFGLTSIVISISDQRSRLAFAPSDASPSSSTHNGSDSTKVKDLVWYVDPCSLFVSLCRSVSLSASISTVRSGGRAPSVHNIIAPHFTRSTRHVPLGAIINANLHCSRRQCRFGLFVLETVGHECM
jgi:hypothetical protein